jgi:hypothetical protein
MKQPELSSVRSEVSLRTPSVNVNTTDATAGATALLLPAQNTYTLHDPIRDTEHARAGGVEDGLGVGGLDGGVRVGVL